MKKAIIILVLLISKSLMSQEMKYEYGEVIYSYYNDAPKKYVITFASPGKYEEIKQGKIENGNIVTNSEAVQTYLKELSSKGWDVYSVNIVNGTIGLIIRFYSVRKPIKE